MMDITSFLALTGTLLLLKVKTMKAIEHLLSDARGVYIPRDFVDSFSADEWDLNPYSWAFISCMTGPDTDDYWQAWEQILNTAEYHQNGHVWRLHQDGDLWAICYELMTDEEKQNFGFEE